jgi:hypothetical protein
MNVENWWNDNFSNTAFPSSNSMWTTMGLNVHYHGEQLASNQLGYDRVMSGLTVLEIIAFYGDQEDNVCHILQI